MQSKLFRTFCFLLVVSLVFANPLLAQEKKGQPKPMTPEELQKLGKGKRHPSKGSSFQIAPVDNSKGMYLALLADEEGRTLTEFFQFDKLPILEAIVAEAKKFGLTEEAVGGAKPLTTRFSDKQVPNFVVDVSKITKQTHFYVTVKTQRGKITIDAGAIKRGDPDATALLFDMLGKLQEVKAHSQIQ